MELDRGVVLRLSLLSRSLLGESGGSGVLAFLPLIFFLTVRTGVKCDAPISVFIFVVFVVFVVFIFVVNESDTVFVVSSKVDVKLMLILLALLILLFILLFRLLFILLFILLVLVVLRCSASNLDGSMAPKEDGRSVTTAVSVGDCTRVVLMRRFLRSEVGGGMVVEVLTESDGQLLGDKRPPLLLLLLLLWYLVFLSCEDVVDVDVGL